MDKIIIKQYDGQERDACIRLLRQTFPGSSDESTFKWRFELNAGRKPLIICAMKGGTVVSFNSWIPWEFSFRNDRVVGFQSGESATDVRYRGKGFFAEILRAGCSAASDLGADFLFGFPSHISFGAFYKTGYHPVNTYFSYLRPINPLKTKPSESILVQPDSLFDSPLTQYDRITPVFDANYYKWRYTNNPKNYETIVFSRDNNTIAFFFRKKKWKNLTEFLLMDVQLNTYNPVFIQTSINLLDRFLTRKAFCVRTFFNEFSHRARALIKYFPIRFKSKYHVLVVKPISTRLSANVVLDCNCWDIMPHCVDYL